jgi:hypothetical protein
MHAEMVIQRWEDDAVLIDLGAPVVARVEPRRSVWPALVLAGFTLLTGAGLATSTNGSGSGGRATGPGATSATTTSRVAGGAPGATSPEPLAPAAPDRTTVGSVAARARAVRTPDGHWTIRASGVADRDVTSIGVRVLVGGAVAGQAAGRLDPPVPLQLVDGRSAGDVAPWSVDIPLAADGSAQAGDAVATVEVRWAGESGSSDDVAELVVRLGDGRAGG